MEILKGFMVIGGIMCFLGGLYYFAYRDKYGSHDTSLGLIIVGLFMFLIGSN